MKSGTPIGSESQCVTCKFSMLLRGFRESEELTYCDFLSQPILVFSGPGVLTVCTPEPSDLGPNGGARSANSSYADAEAGWVLY